MRIILQTHFESKLKLKEIVQSVLSKITQYTLNIIMANYKRPQFSTLVSRLGEEPRHIIILRGPRQSGKTTLVLQALNRIDRPFQYAPTDEPDAPIFPVIPDPIFDDPDLANLSTIQTRGSRDRNWLIRQWELARIAAARSERGFVLAIDEIQNIPNWSKTVKGLWDADRRNDRRLHIVLLGSAPLLMQQGLTESLAGRFETIEIMHWSFNEMSRAFGFELEQYIYFGGYPGSVEYIAEQNRWKKYIASTIVEPNINRDILALQRVDKPALLKEVFEMATAYSGQILSYNKMIGQLQDAGNTTTLARYLDLLSQAGLVAVNTMIETNERVTVTVANGTAGPVVVAGAFFTE